MNAFILIVYHSLLWISRQSRKLDIHRNNEHENKILGNPADSDKFYIIDYIIKEETFFVTVKDAFILCGLMVHSIW